MAIDLSRMIFIDNHAHSLLKGHGELDTFGFRKCFTESRSRAMIVDHVPATIAYMDMVNKTSKILATTDEESLITVRSRQQEAGYVRTLWDDVSLGALIVDDGYNSGEMMTLPQLSAIAQRPVYCCRRIESVLEACILRAANFDELNQLFTSLLFEKITQPVAAIKTIVAYRGGLDIEAVSQSEAQADFDRTKKSLDKDQPRIERGKLYHYFLMQALELAACFEFPVQIHTGMGDDDATLPGSNPLLMQDLVRSKLLEKTNFVFLHCFPFVKEAAFLSSLYPNVFFDLSLAIWQISPSTPSMLLDALSGAPVTKLLAGTDGHSCPETHWYGALCWKRALTLALTSLVKSDILNETQAHEVAAAVLHGNAKRLYKLEGLA